MKINGRVLQVDVIDTYPTKHVVQIKTEILYCDSSTAIYSSSYFMLYEIHKHIVRNNYIVFASPVLND